MTSLLILGAGGHGKVVADAALACNCWREIAFLDDRSEVLRDVLGCPVVGVFDSLGAWTARFSHAVVAVGSGRTRIDLIQTATQFGFIVPTIVHPHSTVSPFAVMSPGTVVMAGAVVNADAVVGPGGIINTAATIDHDCRLEAGVHVCPGAHLAGGVTVGARSWIGIGASVKQGARIGCDVTVGAGATVIDDVPDGLIVVGTPARPLARAATNATKLSR